MINLFKQFGAIYIAHFLLLLVALSPLIPARIEIHLNTSQAEMSSPAASDLSHAVATTTRAIVTAYSEIDSCHYEGCIMANGEPASPGFVACPRAIDFGTKVVIKGEVYECGDRTALRYDGRFDIFIGYGDEAHAEALEFGLKELSVHVLK